MKKDWVELDHDGYGEMMWYESSTLCWLGGEAYAIKDCRRMDTRTVEKTSDITLYKSNAEAVFAWKKRKRYYESYREIKESFVRGELPDNHVFFLGLPGEILKKCGFPSNQMIDLTAYRLKQKSTQENHPFSPLNIKGLDKALQTNTFWQVYHLIKKLALKYQTSGDCFPKTTTSGCIGLNKER